MYKTVVIDRIKNVHERSVKLEELINEHKALGWDFISAIGTVKQETIVLFDENPGFKLNKDINKGLSDVKGKINKMVDNIKK